jgi:NAD(P)-dependent dehydrogenase (short-subunit alcohol dehydrogenase family)
MQLGRGLETTVDNIEVVYQVNHLSHFLLVRLLLPLLASHNKPSRIVHVSSSMHYLGKLDHDSYSVETRNTNLLTNRGGVNSYCDTKLMNIVFSNTLDRYIKEDARKRYSQITSVSIHPGFVVSELDRGIPQFQQVVKFIREMIARPTSDGAITQVTAATNPKTIALGGGLYFEDHCIMNDCSKCLLCTIAPSGAGVAPLELANNHTEQDWLWSTSSKLVGLHESL